MFAGLLIPLAVAGLPIVASASCVPGAAPAYQDISSVGFSSKGVSAPVTIHAGELVRPGPCPVAVGLFVAADYADMDGGPLCFTDSNGKVRSCCGATFSTTEDAPQVIFQRLIAVLQKDRFYDIVQPTPPVASEFAGFFKIVVRRCSPHPHDRAGWLALPGPAQPGPNTSIVTVSIPFGSSPESFYNAQTITLFDDFTHAIYQSKWDVDDVY